MTPGASLAPAIATLGALYLGPCWFHPALVQSFGASRAVRRASVAATGVLTLALIVAIWAVSR